MVYLSASDDDLDRMEIYVPGDEETTDAMHEHLGGWMPAMRAPNGLPDFDRARWVANQCGCCVTLQLHDGCNDVVYEHGPVPKRHLTSQEAASDVCKLAEKFFTATFN